jgi:hypothetical protein
MVDWTHGLEEQNRKFRENFDEATSRKYSFAYVFDLDVQLFQLYFFCFHVCTDKTLYLYINYYYYYYYY